MLFSKTIWYFDTFIHVQCQIVVTNTSITSSVYFFMVRHAYTQTDAANYAYCVMGAEFTPLCDCNFTSSTSFSLSPSMVVIVLLLTSWDQPFEDSTYGWRHVILVSLPVSLFYIMSSRCIHVVTNNRTSYLCGWIVFPYVCASLYLLMLMNT